MNNCDNPDERALFRGQYINNFHSRRECSPIDERLLFYLLLGTTNLQHTSRTRVGAQKPGRNNLFSSSNAIMADLHRVQTAERVHYRDLGESAPRHGQGWRSL